MKKVLIPAILVLLIALGLFWWTRTNAATTPGEESLTTAAVTRGPIRQVVQCTGSIVSNLDVEIKCRASGEVVKLPFDVSDPVKKGELLLELDPVDQERLVQQAEAALAASEARLAQAESNLVTAQQYLAAAKPKTRAAVLAAEARAANERAKAKRVEELLAKKFSSPEEYDAARTAAVQAEQEYYSAQAQLEDLKAQELDLETKRQDINLNKAQVNSNRLALSLAQRQLGYTRVVSPIDGVVSARNVQIGQIIASGISNVGGGTAAMTLSDLSHIFILASVDESDIGLVELGQRADVTVDAYPRLRFRGKVDRIATQGVNLQNVVTFEVRIEILSENKTLLKPVMTANVDIVIAEKEDTLLVPANSIVRERRDTFVTLAKAFGTTEEKHPVEIGISDGVNTEILNGLDEGQTVVVLKPETDSRWRNNESPDRERRNRDRMMMRTISGGQSPGGRR
ncbi:MAG: efflux RND transporter periplasmic adaptor subunit [Candidatus Hydrogenedentes bacterium]|nr:efflux RND transporter periplasmic adaptor subunit [Candidatus Hydrogenedentota bacterium]